MSKKPLERQHTDRLEAWLHTITSQISHVLPPPPVKVAPSLPSLHRWVRGMTAGADLIKDGAAPLTRDSAHHIQAALVVQMVVGNECISPSRLSIIKTLLHPSRVSILLFPCGKNLPCSCIRSCAYQICSLALYTSPLTTFPSLLPSPLIAPFSLA